MRSKFLSIFLMFLLMGSMPVYAVIQDRGIQTISPTTSMTEDILSSIANLDKTLSALNSKLPSLIEARFNYYESIQRQNQVKQVIAELGAFIIALMIYALIRNKNDREEERVLTRSEQILTNIESRIKSLENSKEVTLKIEEQEIIKSKELKSKDKLSASIKNETISKDKEIQSSSKKHISSNKLLSVSELYNKYFPNEEMNSEEVYCLACLQKSKENKLFKLCSFCLTRMKDLVKLRENEQNLIKKQLSMGFCKSCTSEVSLGGLQRGFKLCVECRKILFSNSEDISQKSIKELKDKDIVEVLEVSKISNSKTSKINTEIKKDKNLGIDLL